MSERELTAAEREAFFCEHFPKIGPDGLVEEHRSTYDFATPSKLELVAEYRSVSRTGRMTVEEAWRIVEELKASLSE